MNRTTSSLLDQRIAALPMRKVYTAKIIAVEHASHSFVVSLPGSTRMVVRAAPAIDFGTPQYPKVSRSHNCRVEYDELSGHWVATQYMISNRCMPTTPANVPNVALPSYTPPLPSFNIPSLPPFTAPSYNLPDFQPPADWAPSADKYYDISDGYYGTIAATTTVNLLYFPVGRNISLQDVLLYSNGGSADVTLSVAIDGVEVISSVGDTSTWTTTATFPIAVTAGQIYSATVTTVTSISSFGYTVKAVLNG